MTYVILLCLVILLGFFIGLPFYKKKPIVLTNRAVGVLLFLFMLFLLLLMHATNWFLFSILLLPLLCFIFDIWIVFGIPGMELVSILEKACMGVQLPCLTQGDVLQITDSPAKVTIRVVSRISSVSFSLQASSKKQMLMKKVARKFIDNYHVKP